MMTADNQTRDQAKATIIQKPAEFSIERFTIKPGTLFKFAYRSRGQLYVKPYHPSVSMVIWKP